MTNETEKNLMDASFLDKEGNEVKVSDVISKDDCWFLSNSKEKKWVITHRGVKTIAKLAGVSSNYDVQESEVKPDFKNELEHIVRVTIKCKAKSDGKEGCVHSDENTLTVTGEANLNNTPNRGRGYLRKMAEKRAFDIAVLEHVGLYSSIFSEEESESFKTPQQKDPDLLPGEKDFEAIVDEINLILNAKNTTELKKVATNIKAFIKSGKYTDRQKRYLTELFKRQYGEKQTSL